jgi:integrase
MVPARSHKATGKGRSGKRTLNDLSFHALRHTATSLMKNAGISPAIVQNLLVTTARHQCPLHAHRDLSVEKGHGESAGSYVKEVKYE